MNTKRCPICLEVKNVDDFYVNRFGRPSSYCKSCQKQQQKQWWLDHRTRKLEINRNWRMANRPRRYLMSKVSQIVFHAVKAGTLVRPGTCSKCGCSGKIEAAHSDYTKPLEVIWLCQPCHRKWDSDTPKTSNIFTSTNVGEGRGQKGSTPQL